MFRVSEKRPSAFSLQNLSMVIFRSVGRRLVLRCTKSLEISNPISSNDSAPCRHIFVSHLRLQEKLPATHCPDKLPFRDILCTPSFCPCAELPVRRTAPRGQEERSCSGRLRLRTAGHPKSLHCRILSRRVIGSAPSLGQVPVCRLTIVQVDYRGQPQEVPACGYTWYPTPISYQKRPP